MKPMLRFKADDGSDFPAWEEKALSEIAARVTRKNKGNQTDIPLTISSLDGLVDQRDYFKKTVASKDMSGYFLLRNGEFAYNKSYSVGFDYGSIKRLDKYPCGALSTLYICFGLKPNVKVDSGYLAHYFDSQKWNPEVAAICAEGARNHGLLNVPTADFFDINIAVPSLPEQRKIADLLSAVDDVISAQEAEVAAWEKRKKGVMQKLFSQEVRFKADDGSDFPDWEEQKIEDVCVLNPRTEQLDDEFYYMDLGSIDHGRWEAPEIVNKVDAPSRAQRVAAIDDVFFQSVRPYNMGHYHYVAAKDKQVVASTGYIQARMRNGSNAFLYQLFYEERFNAEVNARCTGSNYPAINSRKFGEITVALPSLPEQRKIADCLSALDDVIIKAKNELAKWQELKKGLLQQMFV